MLMIPFACWSSRAGTVSGTSPVDAGEYNAVAAPPSACRTKSCQISARPLTSGQGCGGLSSSAVPNNVYGYGRLAVYAAYQRAEIAFPPALALAGSVEAAEGSEATCRRTPLERGSRILPCLPDPDD